MRPADRLSTGAWVVCLVAVATTALVLLQTRSRREGIPFWIFAITHANTYRPIVEAWNRENPSRKVNMSVIQYQALERRLLSGFMSRTPVADLVETERRVASRVFAGPVDSIGFVDLKDRLRTEGILEKLNQPSLTPWTSRGGIYGITVGVHPVLLAYRADIIEAAGIDMTSIETWDEFRRTLAPLMEDFDGDGRNDRFLLGGWPTRQMYVETLIRQAGGAFFDEDEKPVLDSAINAWALATMTSWCVGPDRMCVDALESSAPGNKMRLDGTVLCTMVPDWMVSSWKKEIPGIGGKVKVIPVPAFTPGGRRTSVAGGTMLSITKSAPDFEAAWAFAKALYLSPELAESIFRGVGIVTAYMPHWSLPVFDEPDPFFCGQPIGRLFIQQAPNIPYRSSSPFETLAMERAVAAAVSLLGYAEREGAYTTDTLLQEAHRLLALAQEDLGRRVARNVFLQGP